MAAKRRGGEARQQACLAVRSCSSEIATWLAEQDAVGEESITDWLLWQLGHLPFVTYRKFNRFLESRESGADWEWWFVSKTASLGMRVQAKRLRRNKNHYRSIAHVSQGVPQIGRLLADAKANNLLAFYCFYHDATDLSSVRCPAAWPAPEKGASPSPWAPPTSVLMADAGSIYTSCIAPGPNPIPASQLIASSSPLACFFCCPLSRSGNPVEGLYSHLSAFHALGAPTGPSPVAGGAGTERSHTGLYGRWSQMEAELPPLPEYVHTLLAFRHRHEGDDHPAGPPEFPEDLGALVIFELHGDDAAPEEAAAERQHPCTVLSTAMHGPPEAVARLADQNPTVAIWLLRTWGELLPSKAIRELLQQALPAGSDGERYRRLPELIEDGERYRRLPELIEDGERSLLLLERLRRGTRDGNDLYFLWEALGEVERLHPDHARGPRGVEGSRARFFDHIPKPAEALFRKVTTPKDGEVDLWREIPAGEFWMGSPKDEEGRYEDEGPRHQVKITRAFQMAAVPVTNAQYAAFDPGHVWEQWKGVSEEELRHHPVVNVSWYQAVSFCRWLSSCFEWTRGCRLPTEAEWEYACRAGTETRYWSGDEESDLARVGWYAENSGGRTHRVGEKEANPWRLYDVHGNVWEWTASVWPDDYSEHADGRTLNPAEPPEDPAGPPGAGRVIRGGCCWCEARVARAAYRDLGVPWGRIGNLGFRLLLVRPPAGSR